MSNSEFNFTQEITLPSQGLLNPEIPGGKLVQRCMMVADQKFLSGANQSAGSAIHQLIQRTITSPEDFDVSNLTPSDTLYLLFKLRVLSYGEEYKFRTKCPECGKRIDVSLDLSKLPVELLEENYSDNLVVELPHRKDTVYLKVMRNKHNDHVNEEIARRKRKNPNDESAYVYRIASCIEKIVLKDANKGDTPELTHHIDIERYIAELTDYDASAITSGRDNLSYGITPTVEYICPECKEYIDIGIQFSSEFFRPQFSR